MSEEPQLIAFKQGALMRYKDGSQWMATRDIYSDEEKIPSNAVTLIEKAEQPAK